MNKIQQRYIEVHAHWAGLSHPICVGVLHAIPWGRFLMDRREAQLAREVRN